MDIIRHPIKPEKEKAWHFKSHQYFTKQASNVVREYIENFSKEGETVLDPFAGTGVTAIEALALKRKVILLDINPLACFIAEQTIKRIDVEKFAIAFYDLEEKVKPILDSYSKMSHKQLDKTKIKYWYPKKISLPKNSDFDYVEDLFSKRQLLGFSLLFHEINKIRNIDIREMFKFVFSATLSKASLTYMPSERDGKQVGGGGSSIFGKYRYWKPKIPRELEVWSNFKARFSYVLKGKKHWNKLTNGFNIEENFQIFNDSILNLHKYVDQESVDYIYTDPPYGGNIAYLDLSTMWNAWLGFKVSNETKKQEIIEGGDLGKTQDDYEDLLTKSFIKMSAALKNDRWMSLVFAHKKLEFWNVIIDACEDNGLEFKGSTFQPTNNSSIHYKTNPANVLCSQRIANFQKTFRISPREKPDDLKNYIINEIERACLEGHGAGLDKIYNSVLDQLHNNHLIHEAKKKGYLKLKHFLEDTDLFVYEPSTNLYYVKAPEAGENPYVRDFFQNKDELKIILRGILSSKKAMTISEIHKELFDVYKDDKKFPISGHLQDLEDNLKEIAYKSRKTNKWTLMPEQIDLTFEEVLTDKLVRIKNETHSHSEMIFILVNIGNYLGFTSWIGKREQSIDSYQGIKFNSLSLSSLPFTKELTPHQKEKIQQIDVIWFDRLKIPRYGFEVEESTSMNTGIERFTALIDVDMSPAKNLFIIAPKSRRTKLERTFRAEAIFIGHPYYMENKIAFMFKEELAKFYKEYSEDQKHFNESDFLKLKHKIELEN